MQYHWTQKLKQNVCPGHFLSTVGTFGVKAAVSKPSSSFSCSQKFPLPRGGKEKRERKEDTREREGEKGVEGKRKEMR